MQRLGGLFGTVVAILILAGCASPSAPRLSYARAQTLASDSLKRAAIEQLGLIFRDVSDPGSGGFDRGLLTGLALATAPKDAGMPGLCEATILSLQFQPANSTVLRSDSNLDDASAVVRSGATHSVYGISGDTSPGGYDNGLQALRCDELTAWTFFHARDAVDAWYAVRLIDQVRRRSQDGSLVLNQFDCSGPVGCEDRQGILSALSSADIISAEARSCAAFDVGDIRPFGRSVSAGCMLVSVLVAEESNERTIMELGIRFDAGDTQADFLADPLITEAAASVATIASD